MTTQKQVLANRQNAQLSTGPKTIGGKIVASKNATKHGLLSREIVITGEKQVELEIFSAQMFIWLSPKGELEKFLTDRIISCAWRLRRILHIEKLAFEGSGDYCSNKLDLALLFRSCGKNPVLELSRYEIAIERSMYKALHELQRLQAERRGEIVPLPAIAEIDVSTTQNGFVS